MDGSQISARSGGRQNGGWKNSMIKNQQRESRIFPQSKELPTKFSPSKFVEHSGKNTKGLVKPKLFSMSQDEIDLDDRAKSRQKQLTHFLKIETPKSGGKPDFNDQMKLFIQKKASQNTQSQVLVSPRRLKSHSHQVDSNTNLGSPDFIQEIKLQYNRFKEKVLTDLKRLENEIKNTIEEVMRTLSRQANGSYQQTTLNNGMKSNPGQIRPLGLPVLPPASENKKGKQLPKVNLSDSVTIDTNKYRDLLSNETKMESVLPQIKERMQKVFSLMGQLKQEINEQAMYSPVHPKKTHESPERGLQ